MKKLSHSSVSRYNRCPGAWKFKYIDKIPEKEKHYFSLGKSIHSALEFMYTGNECPPLEDVLEWLNTHWLNAGYKDNKAETKVRRDAEKDLEAFYTKFAPSWVKPLATEIKFNITFGHIKVIGFIDRIDLKPDGLHVLDYKTGRTWDSGKALTDEQLTMYQYAAEEMFGHSVASVGLLHVSSQWIDLSPRHSDQMVKQLIEKYEGVHKRIINGDFPHTPSDGSCSYCDYKRLCPQWREHGG